MPWALGPPDGRYLVREAGTTGAEVAEPTHVLVLATLGAAERRRLLGRRARKVQAEPEPAPTPVSTTRATVVDVGRPFAEESDAIAWLADAGEEELDQDLAVLNRALHMFRLATADPYLAPVGRHQALVARIGYGPGEEVAEGRWSEGRALIAAARRQRRARVLQPQARLAALLGGHQRALASEELALRARLDVDSGRPREAALQVLVALDAAIAELATDPAAAELAERVDDLRGRRDPIAHAAQAALEGELDQSELETVTVTVERIEAALRARALARG